MRAFAIYRLRQRINVALLIVFAAGILADAVQNLQELGWVTFLSHPLWNTSGVLSEDGSFGDIVHSFFGYADQPSVLQLIVYVIYVVSAVTLFLGWRPRRAPSNQPQVTRATEPV